MLQPAVRYGTQVLASRDSHGRPFESEREGPLKVSRREPKYFIFDKNGINDSISIDRLKAAYLEGNPNHEDASLTITISHLMIKNPYDTTVAADNQLKTTGPGIKVRFPENLNDYRMQYTLEL